MNRYYGGDHVDKYQDEENLEADAEDNEQRLDEEWGQT